MNPVLPAFDFTATLNNVQLNKSNVHTSTVAHSKSEYVPTLTGYTHTVNTHTTQIKKDKHENITIPVHATSVNPDMIKIWTNMSLENLTKSI